MVERESHKLEVVGSTPITGIKMKKLIQVQAILYRLNKKSYEFLVLKRVPEKKGFWQPITGGKKEGERIKDALYREINEEAGIKEEEILNSKEVHSFNWSANDRDKPETKINFKEYAFGVEVNSKSRISLSKEHEEYKWMPYEEALSLIYHETNKESLRRLNNLLTNGKQ